jgi:hypothetical protein
MISGQTPTRGQVISAIIGFAMMAGMAASSVAEPVTVTDVTDWSTTPMETVNITDGYLNYNGGVYAGINQLSVNNGTSTTVFDGFCIDPFHWSVSGPQSYNMVPLVDGPKSPATLNAFTATEIGDLWAEYFSPTMSSSAAAGLQIAIWELVSSNAVATDGLPASDAFALANGQYDYGASADLASLLTYDGPEANLEALTGPGQDYVIDSAPDGGATLLMLAVTAGCLMLARPALIRCATPRLKPCRVAVQPSR